MKTDGVLRRLAASASDPAELVRRIAGARSAADVWDERSGEPKGGTGRSWTEIARVQEVINLRVSGHPNVDPYLHFLKTRLAGRLPVGRALTIGCGTGELERGLCQYGFSTRHDALDVSPKAIERAKAAAKEAGLGHLSYFVADGNRIRLDEGAYDVIFGVHAVHHIENLEGLFAAVARALKPDGLLFLNEFVGPTRFQWTDRQLEVVNGLLRALPPALRLRTSDGHPKDAVPRPTVEEMIATDPSEAVRSAELMEIAASFFEILEVRPYGGTVLHLLLDDIAGRFQRPEAWVRQALDAAADLEWALLAAGDLASDFVAVVARPKAG